MPSPGGERPLRRAACVGAAATSHQLIKPEMVSFRRDKIGMQGRSPSTVEGMALPAFDR
jgi:hypothetical protein